MSYNISNGNFKVGADAPYVQGGVDVALADGGTGASDAAGARGNLGLGTLATQAANAVNITGGTITGLSAPTNLGDAATKGYVDATTQGLDPKNNVRVVTTANITLSGTQTIDGVNVVANDRVLVKAQTAGQDNGIYVVASGAWVRSVDADTSAKVTAGMFMWATEGATNSDTGWILTTDDPIVLGTTVLAFGQFGVVGQIVAGNGLTKNGNTLDVGAGNGISVLSDSVQVQLDGTTLMVGGPGLKVNTGGVTSNELANAAVTAGKIANGGISANTQFAANVVDGNAIASNAVDSAKIANAAVTAGKIANGGVSANTQFAAGVVDSNALGNAAVTAGKIANGGISANTQFAAGVVDNAALANAAVTPAKMDLAQNRTYTGKVTVSGGLLWKTVGTNTNYTMVSGDGYIGVTDTTAPRTINLVAANTLTDGYEVTVKDETGAASTNNITIDANASETIDGATTKLINTNYGSATLIVRGGNWFVK